MIRAFLAVEVPSSLREALGQVQAEAKNRISRELSPAMRLQWVRPAAIHLTLKFLGDIPESQVDELKSAVGGALRSVAPFAIDVAGLGAFPDLRAPRVLWVGLSGGDSPTTGLPHLAATVAHSVIAFGYPPESRPFNPHLTLARIKEGSKEVGRLLARIGWLDGVAQLGRLDVRSVALMRSDLKPSGSVYTRLWEVPLGAAEAG